jgi:hypothetical protein
MNSVRVPGIALFDLQYLQIGDLKSNKQLNLLEVQDKQTALLHFLQMYLNTGLNKLSGLPGITVPQYSQYIGIKLLFLIFNNPHPNYLKNNLLTYIKYHLPNMEYQA